MIASSAISSFLKRYLHYKYESFRQKKSCFGVYLIPYCELLPPKEVGASCFIHRGYYHIFKKLIKFLEAVFPQSPQAFPISLPDPTIGLSRPYVCSFFLFLGCFHLFIEDPKSLDQDIDRSVFITIMFCSADRTDPGMNVQVLDFLVLVSADIT